MGIAKIAVDLRARTFEIEVSEEHVQDILGRIEALLEAHSSSPDDRISDEPAGHIPPGQEGSSAVTDSGAAPTKPARTRGKSGRLTNWKMVELGLGQDQIEGLREFFRQRSPTTQNDIVAVIGVKLKEYLAKDRLTGDEINSALKLVEQPTPKNLRAVFGNMKGEGIGDADGSTLIVNTYTEDYVKFRMKKVTAKNAK